MSELSHPQISQSTFPAISEERLVAEEAFAILKEVGYPVESRVDGALLWTKLTNRVDIPVADERQVSLRLRSLLAVSMDGGDELSRSGADRGYFVIELQQSDTTEQAELIVDEEIEWRSYFSVIIDTTDIDDVALVDSSTGEELAPYDVMQVLFLLGHIRQEYRNEVYEESLAEAVRELNAEARKVDGMGNIGFRVGDLLDLSACDVCGTENVPCFHNPETLN